MAKKASKAVKEVTEATEAVERGLMDLAKDVTADQITTRMAELNQGFDNRAAFEALNAPANTTIQKKLKSYRAKFVVPGIPTLTLTANVDPNFMNKSGNNASKRFNIYAIDKLADLMHGLNSGHVKKAINICIARSLFRFEAAGRPFTGLAAQGAVSANLKVPKDDAALLIRHTAAPGTAPTQSSSTMNALMVLGVVRNTGSQKHPVWAVSDAPAATRDKAALRL